MIEDQMDNKHNDDQTPERESEESEAELEAEKYVGQGRGKAKLTIGDIFNVDPLRYRIDPQDRIDRVVKSFNKKLSNASDVILKSYFGGDDKITITKHSKEYNEIISSIRNAKPLKWKGQDKLDFSKSENYLKNVRGTNSNENKAIFDKLIEQAKSRVSVIKTEAELKTVSLRKEIGLLKFTARSLPEKKEDGSDTTLDDVKEFNEQREFNSRGGKKDTSHKEATRMSTDGAIRILQLAKNGDDAAKNFANTNVQYNLDKARQKGLLTRILLRGIAVAQTLEGADALQAVDLKKELNKESPRKIYNDIPDSGLWNKFKRYGLKKKISFERGRNVGKWAYYAGNFASFVAGGVVIGTTAVTGGVAAPLWVLLLSGVGALTSILGKNKLVEHERDKLLFDVGGLVNDAYRVREASLAMDKDDPRRGISIVEANGAAKTSLGVVDSFLTNKHKKGRVIGGWEYTASGIKAVGLGIAAFFGLGGATAVAWATLSSSGSLLFGSGVEMVRSVWVHKKELKHGDVDKGVISQDQRDLVSTKIIGVNKQLDKPIALHLKTKYWARRAFDKKQDAPIQVSWKQKEALGRLDKIIPLEKGVKDITAKMANERFNKWAKEECRDHGGVRPVALSGRRLVGKLWSQIWVDPKQIDKWRQELKKKDSSIEKLKIKFSSDDWLDIKYDKQVGGRVVAIDKSSTVSGVVLPPIESKNGKGFDIIGIGIGNLGKVGGKSKNESALLSTTRTKKGSDIKITSYDTGRRKVEKPKHDESLSGSLDYEVSVKYVRDEISKFEGSPSKLFAQAMHVSQDVEKLNNKGGEVKSSEEVKLTSDPNKKPEDSKDKFKEMIGAINLEDARGRTPLIEAILMDKKGTVIKTLIDNGADINQSAKEYTPLLVAMFTGNMAAVNILLKDPNINLGKKCFGKGYGEWAKECSRNIPDLLSQEKALLQEKMLVCEEFKLAVTNAESAMDKALKKYDELQERSVSINADNKKWYQREKGFEKKKAKLGTEVTGAKQRFKDLEVKVGAFEDKHVVFEAQEKVTEQTLVCSAAEDVIGAIADTVVDAVGKYKEKCAEREQEAKNLERVNGLKPSGLTGNKNFEESKDGAENNALDRLSRSKPGSKSGSRSTT